MPLVLSNIPITQPSGGDSINISRSLWRVPTEIWCKIFAASVQIPSLATIMTAFDPSHIYIGREALIICAVCRWWRLIAMNFKALWGAIPIIHRNKPRSISRTIHYIKLSGMQPKILIVGTLDGHPLPQALRSVFKRITTCRRIICWARSQSICPSSPLLDQLPVPQELWVLRRPNAPTIPRVFIPPSFCSAVKSVVIYDTRVEWMALNRLRLEEYIAIISTRGVIRSINESIFPSFPTLEALKIKAKRFATLEMPPHGRTILPALQSISMRPNLLRSLLSYYKLPNWKRLELLPPDRDEDEPWDSPEVEEASIQVIELTCPSITSHIKMLPLYILNFNKLSRFEVQGTSVDVVLGNFAIRQRKGKVIWPLLTLLVVAEYQGQGNSIVKFLRSRVSTVEAQLPRLKTFNCPNISQKTYRALRAWL